MSRTMYTPVLLVASAQRLRDLVDSYAPSVAATREEANRAMVGDAIVRTPITVVDHAITIRAPIREIWPWIAQLGSHRGGWYSYDWIDNGGRPSATRILDEYQDISQGDILPAFPGATDAFVVASVDPPRDLVLLVDGPDGPAVSWEHLLEPIDVRHTRLVVRARFAHTWKQLASTAPTTGARPTPIEHVSRLLGHIPDSWTFAFGRLGHRWMEARHLRGIKRRAEGLI